MGLFAPLMSPSSLVLLIISQVFVYQNDLALELGGNTKKLIKVNYLFFLHQKQKLLKSLNFFFLA